MQWPFPPCDLSLSGAAQLDEEPADEYSIPLWLAVGITVAWMLVSAHLFNLVEKDWNYFQAFYFVFVSFATIGYGKRKRSNAEKHKSE